MSPTELAQSVVSEHTGGAQYQIPISTPPGPGGFEPNLALSYSSNGSDGPFGVGWSFSLGNVEIRCSTRFGVPDYADCPRYEFGGQLLTEDPQTTNRFHTLVESFARVIFNPTGSSSNPESWEVTLPDGTIQRYGVSANSRIASGTHTAQWLLSELEDPSGNKIFITYDDVTDIGTRYPVTITYGPGATPLLPGRRRIDLLYETRPDPLHNFVGGIEREMTLRVREIQVLSYGEIYQRHVLNYADTPEGNYSSWHYTYRSRLSSVQLFGVDCDSTKTDPDTQCTGLPAQEFVYTGLVDSWVAGTPPYQAVDTSIKAPLDPPPFAWTPPGVPFMVGDIDGDGKTEIITADWGANDPAAGPWAAAFAEIEFDDLRMELNMSRPSGPIDGQWNERAVYGATLNGNGLRPIAEASSDPSSPSAEDISCAGCTGGRSIAIKPRVFLLDVDSDGYADVVFSYRLSGVTVNINPDGSIKATPEYVDGKTVSIVFRNTRDPSTGFERSEDLARGLPAFEEVVYESSYFVEKYGGSQLGTYPNLSYRLDSPCLGQALGGYLLFDNRLCYNEIDFAPQFVDLNGDGYLDVIVAERDDENSHSLWVGNVHHNIAASSVPSQVSPLKSRAWLQNPRAASGEDRWVRDTRFDFPQMTLPQGQAGGMNISLDGDWEFSHVANLMLFYDNNTIGPNQYTSALGIVASQYPLNSRSDPGVRLGDLNRDGLTDIVWKASHVSTPSSSTTPEYWDQSETNYDDPVPLYEGVLINTGQGTPGVAASAWCGSPPRHPL